MSLSPRDMEMMGAIRCLMSRGDAVRTFPYACMMTVKVAMSIFDCGYSTAHNSLKRLEARGMLCCKKYPMGQGGRDEKYWEIHPDHL